MISDPHKQRELTRSQIEALRTFPNTRTVRQLRSELQHRLDTIEKKIARLEREDKTLSYDRAKATDAIDEANQRRSRYMKKRHRFIKLVYDRVRGTEYEASYADISHMIALRKRDKWIPIPRVIFDNLSA